MSTASPLIPVPFEAASSARALASRSVRLALRWRHRARSQFLAWLVVFLLVLTPWFIVPRLNLNVASCDSFAENGPDCYWVAQIVLDTLFWAVVGALVLLVAARYALTLERRRIDERLHEADRFPTDAVDARRRLASDPERPEARVRFAADLHGLLPRVLYAYAIAQALAGLFAAATPIESRSLSSEFAFGGGSLRILWALTATTLAFLARRAHKRLRALSDAMWKQATPGGFPSPEGALPAVTFRPWNPTSARPPKG